MLQGLDGYEWCYMLGFILGVTGACHLLFCRVERETSPLFIVAAT